MKVADLVRNRDACCEKDWIGLVMEVDEHEGHAGYWVEYFEDPGNWRWYSFDELDCVEVISESR